MENAGKKEGERENKYSRRQATLHILTNIYLGACQFHTWLQAVNQTEQRKLKTLTWL